MNARSCADLLIGRRRPRDRARRYALLLPPTIGVYERLLISLASCSLIRWICRAGASPAKAVGNRSGCPTIRSS